MANKIRDLFKKLKNIELPGKKSGKRSVSEEYSLSEIDPDQLEELEQEHSFAPDVPLEGQEEEFYQEDATGTVEGIELDDAGLSFKDRARLKLDGLKDKINRINVRKFRTPEIKREEATGEHDSPEKTKPFGLASKGIALNKIKGKASALDTAKLKTIHIELFSPGKRNAIHKGFQLFMVFGAVFILGKSAALFLKGADTVAEKSGSGARIDDSKVLSVSDINDIRNSGLFKTEAAKPVDQPKRPVIAQDIRCKEATKKSRLPIKLLNTVVLQDSVKSIASVQVRSSSELTQVREGDKINDMAKIDLIGRQKIIVKNLQDGACEVIENAEDARRSSPIAVMSPSQSKAFKRRSLKIEGIENEGNTYTIEKDFIQDKMKNISDVLTQARGIQLTNPDGTISFKIVDVVPGGVFSYLGIQNNDVITHINGKKIQNLNEVMSLFGNISSVGNMKITVNRNGEQVPLDYKIR